MTSRANQPRPTAGKPSERDRVLDELAKLPLPSWDELLVEEELSEEEAEKDRVFFEVIMDA